MQLNDTGKKSHANQAVIFDRPPSSKDSLDDPHKKLVLESVLVKPLVNELDIGSAKTVKSDDDWERGTHVASHRVYRMQSSQRPSEQPEDTIRTNKELFIRSAAAAGLRENLF